VVFVPYGEPKQLLLQLVVVIVVVVRHHLLPLKGHHQDVKGKSPLSCGGGVVVVIVAVVVVVRVIVVVRVVVVVVVSQTIHSFIHSFTGHVVYRRVSKVLEGLDDMIAAFPTTVSQSW